MFDQIKRGFVRIALYDCPVRFKNSTSAASEVWQGETGVSARDGKMYSSPWRTRPDNRGNINEHLSAALE